MSNFAGEILLLSVLFICFTALLWFAVGWWVASIDRAKRMQKREIEWNHNLNTLRRDRDAFRDEVEKSHGKIRVLENRRADGKSPPQAKPVTEDERERLRKVTMTLQEKLEAAKRQINGFAMQVDTLTQQSAEREDILEQLKKKLTDTSRTLHDREMRLAQFTEDGGTEDSVTASGQFLSPAQHFATSASADDRIASENARELARVRAEKRSALEAATADRTRLESMLRENEQTLATVREQLAAAQKYIQELQHERENAPPPDTTTPSDTADTSADLKRTISDQEQVIRSLRTATEELKQKLSKASPKSEVTEQLNASNAEIANLKQALSAAQQDVEDALGSKPQIVEQLQQSNEEIDQLKLALAKATEEIEETQRSGSDTSEQLQQRDAKIEELTRALAEANRENEKAQHPGSQLEEKLQRSNDEVATLRQALATATSEAEQQRTEQETRAQQSIETTARELAEAKELNEQATQQHIQELAELHDAMGAQEEIIAQLRRELAGARPAPPRRQTGRESAANLSGDLFAANSGVASVSASNDAAGPPSGSIAPREAPIKVFEQAPERRDNLQRINGIGPKFERALNDAGIYCFDQIAELRDVDIIWLAEVINSFPERIERGNWLSQARELLNPDHQ